MKCLVSPLAQLGVVLGLALTPLSASAATLTLESGTLTLVRFFAGGVQVGADVRGLVAIGVADPGPLGSVTLTDSTGGTDPVDQANVLAVGNASLFALGSVPGEFGAYQADFNSVTETPNGATVKLDLLSTNPAPPTDPALSAFTALGTVFLAFDIQNRATAVNDGFQFLTMTAISDELAAVPEPSTVLLGGLGLAALMIAKARLRS